MVFALHSSEYDVITSSLDTEPDFAEQRVRSRYSIHSLLLHNNACGDFVLGFIEL